MYKNFDSNINTNIVKFSLPYNLLEKYCFDNSELFSFYLNKYLNGEIICVNKKFFFVKYNDYYINCYGIFSFQDLKKLCFYRFSKNNNNFYLEYLSNSNFEIYRINLEKLSVEAPLNDSEEIIFVIESIIDNIRKFFLNPKKYISNTTFFSKL